MIFDMQIQFFAFRQVGTVYGFFDLSINISVMKVILLKSRYSMTESLKSFRSSNKRLPSRKLNGGSDHNENCSWSPNDIDLCTPTIHNNAIRMKKLYLA
jgi:hypothetical protein